MYTYTKRELESLETIHQSWDGAELKIEDEDTKVWLVPRENRKYDKDYQIETKDATGRWNLQSYYFEIY